MALHRDIYWIRRQWAVTGVGMQLIDQRHAGNFDIELARLWEERLASDLSPQKMVRPGRFRQRALGRAATPSETVGSR